MDSDRKKAHWKKAHRKKAHRKKAHMYISEWEKSALGKKRTRGKAHTEKSALGKIRTRKKTHMYRQENTTRKIIFISLLNSEQRHSFVLYFTLFIQRQILFLSLCSLWYWQQSYFVITVQTTVTLTMYFIVYTHIQSFLNLCIIKK